MPHDYTGNPDNFDDSVSVPDDTDPPDAADVVTPLEALIDDVAALAQGYQSPALANLAALIAINTTGLSTGAVRTVVGYGRFRLNKASSETAASPVILAPTTGGGRWEAQDLLAKEQWTHTFQTNGDSLAIPSVISRVYYDGWGNGGGGGGGAGGVTGGQTNASGGAGAGAQRYTGELDVTPTSTASFANVNGPGSGGAGGVAGAAGADANDGDDCTLTIGSSQLIFPGAQGGRGGGTGNGTTQFTVPGGSNAGSGSPKLKSFQEGAGNHAQVPVGPGAGGWGGDNFSSPASGIPSFGARSREGFTGGGVGAVGATNTNPGGIGGGGGGAGPMGAGGHGGAGGAGAASGAGANGSAGTVPPTAFSGAGGGGGGGGGNGSSGTSNGGAGAAGERGQVFIRGVR